MKVCYYNDARWQSLLGMLPETIHMLGEVLTYQVELYVHHKVELLHFPYLGGNRMFYVVVQLNLILCDV